MRYAAALCCAIVFLAVSGCGLLIPEPEPLSVDQSVADAMQVVQSFKHDIEQKQQTEIKTQNISVQSNWFETNWSWLAWVFLVLIFGIMWIMEKSSDRWGIPSQETMDRMSYYLTKCLPLTQKAIYKALRKKYLKSKENGE